MGMFLEKRWNNPNFVNLPHVIRYTYLSLVCIGHQTFHLVFQIRSLCKFWLAQLYRPHHMSLLSFLWEVSSNQFELVINLNILLFDTWEHMLLELLDMSVFPALILVHSKAYIQRAHIYTMRLFLSWWIFCTFHSYGLYTACHIEHLLFQLSLIPTPTSKCFHFGNCNLH